MYRKGMIELQSYNKRVFSALYVKLIDRLLVVSLAAYPMKLFAVDSVVPKQHC